MNDFPFTGSRVAVPISCVRTYLAGSKRDLAIQSICNYANCTTPYLVLKCGH